ncbi:MOSC domain-containing protein [Sphingomonas sp.]|uniref:MOSC domain-containing protein n=1 Tax=Sphingomonas sp. TaxID=28214 RepID=UPI0035BC8CE6
MWLSHLFRFPVKSLGGQALPSSPLEPRGLTGDRRWMVIDARNRFITRRDVPAMALVDAVPAGATLTLSHPVLGSCVAAAPGAAAPVVDAVLWRDTVALRLGNDAADAFLSEALGRPVRLAHQFDASVRPVHPRHAQAGDHVSLADGYPLLVTTQASLAALNARLATPVSMARFRPNLVIAGTAAWAEDRWRTIRVGDAVLRIAAPCPRCLVVTQEPRTGERTDGNEPLTTLRAMGRMAAGGIMFGQNAIPDGHGSLRVGDQVEVLAEGDSNVPPSIS